MRIPSLLILLALGTVVAAREDKARLYRFSKDDLGKTPTGWKAAKTGTGAGSIWKIVQDDTAPSKFGLALAQLAESPNGLFNICVAMEDIPFKDGQLEVAFKAIAGKNDQGGGLVWRYQDHNNYYVCRMNPLEDNYRVYKEVNGKRIQIGGKEGVKVKTGEWRRLKVVVKGTHMEGYLDGEKMWAIDDDTFKKGGKVGVWSKSDAQTHFDELMVSNDR